MKLLPPLLVFVLLFSVHISAFPVTDTARGEQIRQYTPSAIAHFLDSVGRLSPVTMMNETSFYSDSLFLHQAEFNQLLTATDFALLKTACKNYYMDTANARKIFPGIGQIIDSEFSKYETIPVTLYSFGKGKYRYTDFAVLVGNSTKWDCDLYFFKGRRLLAHHNVNHHYGLELHHYKDADGTTVIYYKRNYMTGTGIYWYNFQFYKYCDTHLVPALNELQLSGISKPWSYREHNFISTIASTNPLTIKMVYSQDITDESSKEVTIQHKDSVMVRYTWDASTRSYRPHYGSKLSRQKILTYYLEDNELLFLNTNYAILKKSLNDKRKRKLTLFYLNKAKNNMDNTQYR